MTENEIRASMTSEQILLERKLTCEAINGAIAFGYLDTNPPPADDHWLAPFWKIGRERAELESKVSTPSAPAVDAGARDEPEAWRIFDGEGGYDYRDSEPTELMVSYAAKYGRKYEPLYTAPPAATRIPGQLSAQDAMETAVAHALGGKPVAPCDCIACVKMRGHQYGELPDTAPPAASGQKLTAQQVNAIEEAVRLMGPLGYLSFTDELRALLRASSAAASDKQGGA